MRLWRAKTPGERALRGFRLWNSVKHRIMSAMQQKYPDIDPNDEQCSVTLKKTRLSHMRCK